jgi:hypothetical protein
MAHQPPSILGKTDLYSLLDFTPTMPANTADAAIRVYGTNSQPQSLPSNLDSVYDPFFRRATAAHNGIKKASASRTKNMPSQAENGAADPRKSTLIRSPRGWAAWTKCSK